MIGHKKNSVLPTTHTDLLIKSLKSDYTMSQPLWVLFAARRSSGTSLCPLVVGLLQQIRAGMLIWSGANKWGDIRKVRRG